MLNFNYGCFPRKSLLQNNGKRGIVLITVLLCFSLLVVGFISYQWWITQKENNVSNNTLQEIVPLKDMTQEFVEPVLNESVEQKQNGIPETSEEMRVAEENNILDIGMSMSAEGAIDLIVTDPDGFTITPDTIIPSDEEYIREIPGILYYSEMERGRDGNPIVRVYSPRAKAGEYAIKIAINSIKAQNLSISTSTRAVFWLDFTVGDQTLNLASGTHWMDIPTYGYGVYVHQDGSVESVSPSHTTKFKTYHNTDFGFEFQYPDDCVVEENTFGSYYSKFNLVVRPTTGWISQFPISVNIVLPEFPELSFKNVEKTTFEVTVDGVPGVKYQYEFEGGQETAIILPLGEHKAILASDDERYTDIFNQILDSFKFLE